MEKKVLLKTYTKNEYLRIFPCNSISDHREDTWIEKLEKLLDLSETETHYNYNSTLCILALLTACFMQSHELYAGNKVNKTLTNSQTKILKQITYYDYGADYVNDINIKLTQRQIDHFFSFYMHYLNIWEYFEYESEAEKKEILAYRKRFIDTYDLWAMTRQSEGSKHRFSTDIPQFVKALYHRDQLPNPQKYYDTGDIPDFIVENLTAFKVIDGEIR